MVCSVCRSILADKTSRNLFSFLCLNLSFAFVELLYGIWSNRYRGGGAAGPARLQRGGSGASRPASATSPLGGAGPLGSPSGGAVRQSLGGRWTASPDRDRSRGQRPAPPSPLPGPGDAGEATRRLAEECCLELLLCSVLC